MGLDTERLKHRGRLEEKREAARKLELGISGDVIAVRHLLDPYAKVHEIKADLAAEQAVEMAAKHAEYMGLLAEIKAIEKALGR